ncbi:MAG: hypothetical protein VYE15_04250, partial [Myxococcota bacterium]|nr:hypothetical protein [Myxococcota bacterium]
MIRGVMEMLPLMSDSERGSAQEGSEAAVFRLPDAESVTLDGSMGDSMGETIMEGVGARSEQEAPSEETREDVAVGDDTATETDSEGTSVEAKDDGEVRAADSRGGEKRQSTEESSGHKDDTVEAQQAARMGLVDQMASQSERLASAGKKGRISASDLLAAGRKKVLDLDGLA